MPFGLIIGTERAETLQQSIQDELTRRGYSPDADPVMAEYITIMIINNKTAAQITSELEDLIGSDFDHSFTDWLFTEAAKGVSGSGSPSHPQAATSDAPPDPSPVHEAPQDTPNEAARRPPNAPRNGPPLYQQALSQVLPSSSPSAQKRSASARSPSPNHPNKSRRTDLPTGPRAMLRDGNNGAGGSHVGQRSLLERVGGPAGPMRNTNAQNAFPHDDIQARIDNITNGSPDPTMMMAGFPHANGMGAMDMNAMAAGMANPMMLQEMMMGQMALMAQMASSMGMMNPTAGQFAGPGFPMQGVMPGDMGMFPGAGMTGLAGPLQQQQQQQMTGMNSVGRGRGGGRGGRGTGRGRVGQQPSKGMDVIGNDGASSSTPGPTPPLPIAAPTPALAVPPSSTPSTAGVLSSGSQPRTGFVLPERPQSPTLCKFALKCTNAHCRYSHPSPVATAESGMVLSNEACEKGKDCKDKDCIKAHVSPAVLNPLASEQPNVNASVTLATPAPNSPISCRFGAACTRPNCTFAHPSPRHSEHHKSNHNHFAQQCRFGASCTRATCPFQHPEGRVLPTTFHRGLSTSAPIVNVQTPEAGSMGGPSHHRSVTFNTGKGDGGVKEKLERQMKEIEEKKSEAEKAVKDAEAAVNKKDESKPVAIAA